MIYEEHHHSWCEPADIVNMYMYNIVLHDLIPNTYYLK